MPPIRALRASRAPAQGSSFAALWRTRVYLRPYFWPLVIMLAAALGGVAVQLVIPLRIKEVIDGAIMHGRRGLLTPLGLATVGLGAAEAGCNLLRRWVQSGAVTGIEQSMRGDLYAHVQRLQPAFHDSWQSGQLLSRATTDLSAIRRFAGFGIVFFITSLMTFAAVVALLIHLNWWLGLVTGVVFAPVVPVCLRFEKRYR